MYIFKQGKTMSIRNALQAVQDLLSRFTVLIERSMRPAAAIQTC
jgi:hypothetical protein